MEGYRLVEERDGFSIVKKDGWYHVHSNSPFEWILDTRSGHRAADCLEALVSGNVDRVRELQALADKESPTHLPG